MSDNNSEDNTFLFILNILTFLIVLAVCVILIFGWNYTGSVASSLGGIDPKVFDKHLSSFEKKINDHVDKSVGSIVEKSANKLNSVFSSEINKFSQSSFSGVNAVSKSVSEVDKKLSDAEIKINESINKLLEKSVNQNQKLLDDSSSKFEKLLSDNKSRFDKLDSVSNSLIQTYKENVASLNKQNNDNKDVVMSLISAKSTSNLEFLGLLKKEFGEKQNYISGQVLRLLSLFDLSSDEKLPGVLLVLDCGESMSELVFDDIINDIRSVSSSAIKFTPKRKFGFSCFRGDKVVQALPFSLHDSLSVNGINKNDLIPDRNEVNNWKNSILSSVNRLSSVDGPKRLVYITCNPNNLKPLDLSFVSDIQRDCAKHGIEIWLFHFLRNKDDLVSNDLSAIALGNGGQYFPIRLSKDFNKDASLVKTIKQNFLSFLYQSFGLNLSLELRKFN